MKTVATIVCTVCNLAFVVTAAPTAHSSPCFRQLQFSPPFGNQATGFAPEAAPLNGEQMPIGAAGPMETGPAGMWNGNAARGAGAGAGAEAGSASATTDLASTTTTTTDTTAGATSPQAAATTTSDIAPGQPTIMVLLPDFLAGGSGWSSYSGDVSATHAPETKPVEETPTSAAAAVLSPVWTAMTLAVAVGASLALLAAF